jgi:hypothetical protein
MQLMLLPHIAAASSDPKRIDQLEAYAKQQIPTSAREYGESAIATINLSAKPYSGDRPLAGCSVGERARSFGTLIKLSRE